MIATNPKPDPPEPVRPEPVRLEPVRPEPVRPEPDDKDWTWVLGRPCPDCGFDGTAVTGADVAGLSRAAVPRWRAVLGRADATVRPAADVWSPLEYGCHVRDVFAIFDGRAQQMLAEDDPLFANWDQDATALELRYWEQSPSVVADELAATGAGLARTFDGIAAGQWDRAGRRSNGSVFTLDSLGRYFLHDLVHHLDDVNG